jgi:hypothetical protein
MELRNPLTMERHRGLPSLVHDLDRDYHEEIVRSAGKVTDIIQWTDVSKTKKIRETSFTYAGNRVDTETIKQYDDAGALLETLVLQYTYSGAFVISVDSVRT